MKIYVTGIIFSLFILLSGCSTVYQHTQKDSALNLYVRGLVDESNGNINGARSLYVKALKLNPDNGYLYEKLGKIALKDKKYKESVEDFKESIRSGSQYPDNYFGLGLAYLALGNYKDAESNLEAGLKKRENNDYRIILSGVYIKTGRYRKAEKSYKLLVKKFPDNILILYNYASILGKENKFLEAEKIYKKIINSAPYFINAYVNLVLMYEKQNEPGKAENYCRELIASRPENSIGYSLLSFIYVLVYDFIQGIFNYT